MNTTTMILTTALSLSILINLLIFILFKVMRKNASRRIEDLHPYSVGSVVENEIFVNLTARLHPEGAPNSFYTVYDLLDSFYKNPAKLFDSFYTPGNGFGVTLPICKIEGNQIFVKDLKGNSYRLAMKQLPSNLTLNLTTSDDE